MLHIEEIAGNFQLSLLYATLIQAWNTHFVLGIHKQSPSVSRWRRPRADSAWSWAEHPYWRLQALNMISDQGWTIWIFCHNFPTRKKQWLVGGLEHEFYFSIYWEESSQLTSMLFRGVGQPPTRWVFRMIVAIQSLGYWILTQTFLLKKWCYLETDSCGQPKSINVPFRDGSCNLLMILGMVYHGFTKLPSDKRLHSYGKWP